jgi:D-arabinose 1-dehydrogenase-like Zn-dependent alcohol dehydrogenase
MRSTHSRAAVLAHARGPVTVESLHFGEPAAGEILLRMEACGLCHSDLFVAGLEKLPLAPLTLGHEGIGRVAAVGPGVAGWAPGDRAGITFLGTTCGACEWCAAGRERFCPKQTNFGYTLQGALGDYALAPASALVRVPESLPAAGAAPLCCAGWTAYEPSAKLPLPPANRWLSSATAGSATWRFKLPCTRDCARRFATLRKKSCPSPAPPGRIPARLAIWTPRLSSPPRRPPSRKPSARCAAMERSSW